MLKYPCLVLDHDDTVVQSEATINYPFFCQILEQYRPGQRITLSEYVQGCFSPGFAEMCRSRYQFTDQELEDEFTAWCAYSGVHIPAFFPGIENVIRRQKAEGGLICVVSQSSRTNILRDYQVHFGIRPDAVYGWDLPEEKRKPSTFALNDIMQTFHLAPEELLMVDDLLPGCEMARKAGVPTAFAAWNRLAFPPILARMRQLCDFSFDSPGALEEFLFDALDNRGIISTGEHPGK